MSIIRIVHNKENPFVQLNKKALWNEDLSLKAIGLWARCMSRPDDWRFNVKELVARSKEGRRAIDGAISELIEHGYAIRLEHWDKSEDGKFSNGGVEYAFFEFPATDEDKAKVLEEFKKSFRHCGFGNCRFGDSRNVDLLNKERKPTQKKEREGEGHAPPNPPPPTFSFKRISMSSEKHEALVQEFGEQRVKDMLDRLDEYADINPKRFKQYACHAAVIRKWIRDDGQKAPTGKVSGAATLVNEEFAKKIEAKYPQQTRISRDPSVGTSLEIKGVGYGGYTYILFKETGFKDQVINCLRKLGLPIDGL